MEQRDCFYATNSLRLSNVVRCCTPTTRRGRLVRSGLVLVRQLIMLAARPSFHRASADQHDASHALSRRCAHTAEILSLIHISEPTRQAEISYAVFCLKK